MNYFAPADMLVRRIIHNIMHTYIVRIVLYTHVHNNIIQLEMASMQGRRQDLEGWFPRIAKMCKHQQFFVHVMLSYLRYTLCYLAMRCDSVPKQISMRTTRGVRVRRTKSHMHIIRHAFRRERGMPGHMQFDYVTH